MLIKPGLYIVSTPIGNLEDITFRALQTLKQSTLILCEDTRVSNKLLTKYSISTRLAIYNDHSDANQRANVKELVSKGEIVSLVCDAGTPLIADPGYKLVKYLQQNDCHVEIIPGVSSVIAALTISGLPSDRFFFGGFLPKTLPKKKKILQDLSNIQATLIFFETANRLISSLVAAQQAIGNRQACVARELTKMYQEIKSGYLEELIEFYTHQHPKGELVLLISGVRELRDKDLLTKDLINTLKHYLHDSYTAKDATEAAYEEFKDLYTKKEIYSLINQLKNNRNY